MSAASEAESVTGGSLLRHAADAIQTREGAVLIPRDGPDRPDLILVDRRVGLYAIEVNLDDSSADGRALFVRLNRKRAELRETLGALAAEVIVGAAVVLGAAPQRGATVATGNAILTSIDLQQPAWPDRLPAHPLDERTFDAVVERLAPAVVFNRHGRTTTADIGAALRAAMRIQLDAAQAAAALTAIDEVSVVTGPPGSGKTLLLAARARYLAAAHPDWRVAVVVFNHALVPYLRSLIGAPSVSVETVGAFAHKHGLRIEWEGGPAAARELARVRNRGLDRTVDALLIDEGQDFDAAWVELLLDIVRPHRGGALIVADAAQALYRELAIEAALHGRQVLRTRLARPYRSTQSILRAAQALTPDTRIAEIDHALDGTPVDLVWASSWDEQADCIAAEINAMTGGGLREPGDIAILVTRRVGALRRLRDALDRRQVPYELIDRGNAKSFDPTTPTVKMLTVHAGKGHEFPVVVLFGLEALPAVTNEETHRQQRVGFVGATRAKDQLLITYTRTNAHLERLIALGDHVNRWTWPDDYEDG